MGRDHVRQQAFHRFAGFHDRQFRHGADDAFDIVAFDYRDRHIAQPLFFGHLAHGARTAAGIGRAHIGDDANALVEAEWQDAFHALDQARVVAFLRVVALGQALARGGPLGQAFEDEEVQIGAFDQVDGGFDTVIRETGAYADAHYIRWFGHAGYSPAQEFGLAGIMEPRRAVAQRPAGPRSA